jgi:hypothetical protein
LTRPTRLDVSVGFVDFFRNHRVPQVLFGVTNKHAIGSTADGDGGGGGGGLGLE